MHSRPRPWDVVRAVVLLALFAALAVCPARGDDDRWAGSIAEARRQATAAGKPVLCVFLVPSHSPSRSLKRLLESNRKLREQLDDFVCVQVDPRREKKLVQQHRMQVFPVLYITTPRGQPIKLVAGRMPLSKVNTQLAEALVKWEKVKDPTKNRPKARERSLSPLHPPEHRVHPSTCPHECDQCDPAVERAIGWLAGRQRGDGGWGKLADEVETKTESGQILDRSIDHIDVALTSVAGLALLADGSTRKSGTHRARLTRAVSFVLRHVRDDGILSSGEGRSWLALEHSNFETALGAMFLAEVHAQSPDTEIRKRLEKIARLLERAQDTRSGGWGYSYDSTEFGRNEKRGWRLLATTHVCMSALNAIRDAGIDVDAEALQRGARYLRSCVNKWNDFTYRTETSWGKGHAGAAAGALYAISRAGIWEAEQLERFRHMHRLRYRGIEDFGQHWWFSLLFTALAMNDRGEGSWVEAHEYFRDIVLHNQREDGSWDEPDNKAGRVFATSLAVFFLRFGRGTLPIAARRTGDREIEQVAKPRYLKPPHPTSRVKVFERDGGYLVDLIVSVDGPVEGDYLEHLRTSIRGANRLLYDVTDGQMSLHRVELATDGKRWDEADVMVTTGFQRDESLPTLGAHGFTMVSKRTEIRRGRDVESPRIGEWVKLPYYVDGVSHVMPWQNRGPQRVFAHELAHYLLGIQDEYGFDGTYCRCLVGDTGTTELCNDATHTDDRRERSCWEFAKRLYPKLVVPTVPDPGPWDPPTPVFVPPR